MIKPLILSLLIFAIGLFTYLFFYLGAYKNVEMSFDKRGPLLLLYKSHVGAYHEIGPTIAAVETWAGKQNLPCPQTFGEYLDDPEALDQDRLRSRGGCLLTGPLPPATANPDFTFETRPVEEYFVAHWEGSPAIGPFKVYPKVKEFLAQHRLKTSDAVIEIYSINGDKVTTDYLFHVLKP